MQNSEEPERKKSLKDYLPPQTSESMDKALAYRFLCTGQSENLLKLLLERQWVDEGLTFCGQSSLHLATMQRKVDLVRLLLRNGASVDTRDKLGRTALHYACAEGLVEVVEVLDEAKADFNVRTIGGETPLMKAGQFCQRELIRCMIERYREKIDFNSRNNLNQSTLDLYKIGINKTDWQEDGMMEQWQQLWLLL